MKLLYFAYGSNLHPARLRARVGPFEPLGRARVAHYRLAFHKRGADGSGKCDIVPAPGREVHGALYLIDAGQRALLDRFEGVGRGYRGGWLEVHGREGRQRAYCYFAQPGHTDPRLRPYGWYKDFVLEGGRRHRLPHPYLRALVRIPHLDDPDPAREARNRALLAAPG